MALNRRSLLAGVGAGVVLTSGCAFLGSPAAPAHWVTVYLGDREETHEVGVTVTNERGTTLFERESQLSDDNEAEEDATFPGSSEPDRIVVTVDGTRFERDWPGFEHPALPCEGRNRAGVEIWVENGPNGTPNVRVEADCQYVTVES